MSIKDRIRMQQLEEARQFRLPVGNKYKGQTLETIGSSSEGLRYLDWIIGQDWLWDSTRKTIEIFLADPTVDSDLNDALGEIDDCHSLDYDDGDGGWEHWK